MKCPKCGYNSFEYYDSCKKCANDLTSYKETYGIKAIVLPAEARASMAEELMAQAALNDQNVQSAEAPVDMFSFDVPESQTTATAEDDPFNFDDDPISTTQSGGAYSFGDGGQSAQAKAEEDAFADLLESTSQKDQDFASATATNPATESDLGSFSWDDSPVESTTSGAKPADDDFNTLFGELDEPAKK